MFSNSFKNNESLSCKVSLLRDMQIFKNSNQKRRSSDMAENELENFINLAFKVTVMYDEAVEKFNKLRKKTDKFSCLEKYREQIIKLRNKFNLLYSKQKTESEDSYKNKYILFSHNIILSSELSILNEELKLVKKYLNNISTNFINFYWKNMYIMLNFLTYD